MLAISTCTDGIASYIYLFSVSKYSFVTHNSTAIASLRANDLYARVFENILSLSSLSSQFKNWTCATMPEALWQAHNIKQCRDSVAMYIRIAVAATVKNESVKIISGTVHKLSILTCMFSYRREYHNTSW